MSKKKKKRKKKTTDHSLLTVREILTTYSSLDFYSYNNENDMHRGGVSAYLAFPYPMSHVGFRPAAMSSRSGTTSSGMRDTR